MVMLLEIKLLVGATRSLLLFLVFFNKRLHALLGACLHMTYALWSWHSYSCWTQKEAYGEAPSDSSDDEEWSGKSTPTKDNEESEADSPAGKSLHPDSLHGSVDKKHGDLRSNGSNSATRKGHFGPVINQVQWNLFTIRQDQFNRTYHFTQLYFID